MSVHELLIIYFLPSSLRHHLIGKTGFQIHPDHGWMQYFGIPPLVVVYPLLDHDLDLLVRIEFVFVLLALLRLLIIEIAVVPIYQVDDSVVRNAAAIEATVHLDLLVLVRFNLRHHCLLSFPCFYDY